MKSSILSTAFALIKLGRLQFLTAGIVFHLLGVAMALYSGVPFHLAALLWGQLAITAVQMMTHYNNEYFDLEADRANRTPTNWSGGSRVLVSGTIPPRVALSIAIGFAVFALIANFVLSIFIRPSLTTFALFGFAQFLAWFYSAPPLRLHSRGFGEVTTMITVSVLTPLAGYLLHAGSSDFRLIFALFPLCCFQFAMLLAIEFPDADGDRQTGKRTLVVRMGAENAIRLYAALIVAAFVSLPLLVGFGVPPAVSLAVAALLPVGLILLRMVWRGAWRDPNRWNTFAFYTVVLLIGSAILELVAFVLLIGMR